MDISIAMFARRFSDQSEARGAGHPHAVVYGGNEKGAAKPFQKTIVDETVV